MNINPATISLNRPYGLAAHPLPASRRQVESRTVCLERGELLRLEKGNRISRVAIINGAMWLTGTPAETDIVLKGGGRFEFKQQWPYLIEALERTDLVLFLA